MKAKQLLKHHKLFFQLSIFFCIALFSARAQAADLEVQLGAFTIKSIAEKCESEYQQLGHDVYIKQIKNAAGKSYYTVRSGPFESIEKARAFINSISPAPEDRPWIARADSMQPAEQSNAMQAQSPHSSDALDGSSKAPPDMAEAAGNMDGNSDLSENPSQEKKPEKTETADTGLWGAAADSDKPGEEPADDPEEFLDQKWDASDKTEDQDTSPRVNALEQEVRELKQTVQTLLDAREVREELEATEEEEREKEEDILSAAGRQYVLLQKGRLGVEYKLDYSYFAYDAVREQNIIEHNSQHNITNTFTIEYPLKDNLSVEMAVPFIYKYDKVGSDNSKDVSDFGDVDFAVNYQPFKSGARLPSIIFRTVLTCPMGRDPYDINPDTELSTGSGGYSLQGSMSVSKVVDPIMVFGSLGYTYKHPIDDLDYKLGSYTLERYERGDTVELSMGIGYSLSYVTSLTIGYSYAYSFEDKRFFKEAQSQTYETRTQSSLNIGTSWRLSKKLRMNMSLGIGLANSDYYTLSFRFPFEFDL